MPSVPRAVQLQQSPHPPGLGPHRLLVQACHCRGYASPLTAKFQRYSTAACYSVLQSHMHAWSLHLLSIKAAHVAAMCSSVCYIQMHGWFFGNTMFQLVLSDFLVWKSCVNALTWCNQESPVWVNLPQQTKSASVNAMIGHDKLKGCCPLLQIHLTLHSKSFFSGKALLMYLCKRCANQWLHVLTHSDMCRLQICGTLPSADSATGYLHFSGAICH